MLRFKPVWGLCACASARKSILQLGRGSSFLQNSLKGVCRCSLLPEELSIRFITELGSRLLFLCFCIPSLSNCNCSCLPFGTQERPKGLRSFSYKQEVASLSGLLIFRKVLPGSCLNHSPCFGTLSPGENRDGTRKGIRFWAERLIFSSTEELSFRGTRFWWQDTHTEGEC